MTILYPTPAPVKKARRFGAGLLAFAPYTGRIEYTASDSQWWASQNALTEDRHYDEMAEASGMADRLERGLCG